MREQWVKQVVSILLYLVLRLKKKRNQPSLATSFLISTSQLALHASAGS